MIQGEDNFVRNVIRVRHLHYTKSVVFKYLIGDVVLLEAFVEVADSCDVKEFKVIFPTNPKGSVVRVNVVNLSLG